MRRHSIRLHELSSRDVVARADSSKVGTLADLLFSPADGEIRFLLVETASGLAGLIRHKGYVAREDLLAVGTDAVIVRDSASVKEVTKTLDQEELVSAAALKNRPVVTDTGERIGQVSDFEFDPGAGRIVAYVITVSEHGSALGLGIGQPRPSERVIPMRRDVIVGDELITVPMTVIIDSEPDTVAGPARDDEGRDSGEATRMGDPDLGTTGRYLPKGKERR